MEDSEKLRLIPMWGPLNLKDVQPLWELINDGLVPVLDNTNPKADIGRVYNQILDGTLTLWLGYINGAYKGFITTYIETVPFQADLNPTVPLIHRHLIVCHGFAKPGIDRMKMTEALSEIKKHAKDKNCSHVKFLTIRDSAMERRLAPHGWERGFTEFFCKVV